METNSLKSDSSGGESDKSGIEGLARFFAAAIWEEEGGDYYYIEPRRPNDYTIRARIHGAVSTREDFDAEEQDVNILLKLFGIEPMQSRIRGYNKLLDLSACQFLPASVRTVWRLQTLPAVHGTALTLRRRREAEIFSFDQLGFLPEQVESIKQTVGVIRGGLIVVAGGTKAGKTTTVNALTNALWIDKQVIEISDGSAAPNENRTQIDTNRLQPSSEKSNAMVQALETAAAICPDVIICPEIRSKEELAIAVKAVFDGQIVVLCLHAEDTARAIERLLFYSNADLLAETLKIVIAQKIVRTDVLPEAVREARGSRLAADRRLAIGEVLTLNSPLKSHLRKTAHPGKLVRLAQDKDNFRTMADVIKIYRDTGTVFPESSVMTDN